ncbi:hypothetical protein PAECIP111894_05058 [Paenibacillus pseudetheri]|uniref:Uncharacterized protein n=1 Tax=Paenibacillus pseudetheri TaxID=2897682 RepID=A0ABM9BL95_9BACL|nr:hypothetical protein PAECIP111894_05058 [Paenibacillus pseudetheri]
MSMKVSDSTSISNQLQYIWGIMDMRLRCIIAYSSRSFVSKFE